jgi:hypothetical protein
MQITPDGKYLLIVCEEEVSIVNISSMSVKNVGFSGNPILFGNSESVSDFYLINSTIPYGTLWIMDTTTGRLIHQVKLLPNSTSITVSPNKKYVYEILNSPYGLALNSSTNTLQNTPYLVAINSSTNSTKSISINSINQYPTYLETSPDGKYLYVAESSGDVSAINTSNNQLAQVFPNLCGGAVTYYNNIVYPDILTLTSSSDSNSLYVLCRNSENLTKLNVTNNKRVVMPLNSTYPLDQIAFTSSDTFAYLITSGAGSLIMNITNGKIIDMENTMAITITPDGRYIYYADPYANQNSSIVHIKRLV